MYLLFYAKLDHFINAVIFSVAMKRSNLKRANKFTPKFHYTIDTTLSGQGRVYLYSVVLQGIQVGSGLASKCKIMLKVTDSGEHSSLLQ
jgi:hypothetical protein